MRYSQEEALIEIHLHRTGGKREVFVQTEGQPPSNKARCSHGLGEDKRVEANSPAWETAHLLNVAGNLGEGPSQKDAG